MLRAAPLSGRVFARWLRALQGKNKKGVLFNPPRRSRAVGGIRLASLRLNKTTFLFFRAVRRVRGPSRCVRRVPLSRLGAGPAGSCALLCALAGLPPLLVRRRRGPLPSRRRSGRPAAAPRRSRPRLRCQITAWTNVAVLKLIFSPGANHS